MEPPQEPTAGPPPDDHVHGGFTDKPSELDEAAADWFTTRFNLVILGKRVDAGMARSLIIGLGVLVVVLLVALVSGIGSGDTMVETVIVHDGAAPTSGDDDLVSAGRYSDPGRFLAGTQTMTWADSKQCEHT